VHVSIDAGRQKQSGQTFVRPLKAKRRKALRENPDGRDLKREIGALSNYAGIFFFGLRALDFLVAMELSSVIDQAAKVGT
jgi:hypothetical protein